MNTTAAPTTTTERFIAASGAEQFTFRHIVGGTTILTGPELVEAMEAAEYYGRSIIWTDTALIARNTHGENIYTATPIRQAATPLIRCEDQVPFCSHCEVG